MSTTVVILSIISISLLAVLVSSLGALREAREELSAARECCDDLTSQLEDYNEKRTTTRLLRLLTEAAYDPMFVVGQDARVIYMNKAGRKLFGIKKKDLRGHTTSVIAVTRHHELDDAVQEAHRTEERFGTQISIWGRPYRVRVRPVNPGSTKYVTVVMEDVSELERLGRARRDLVANISHELRTPITSIRLLSETLEREMQRNDYNTTQVQKIIVQTESLEQMAQELLDLSMIESGRAEFIFQNEHLYPLVEEVLGGFSEQIRRNHLGVVNNIDPDLYLLVDAEQIRRVLKNLISNSIKYTPQRGEIHIYNSGKRGEWVSVYVADSGPGIPVENRDRIFERFFRADRSRQRSGGTGLGLAIAKHIVQAHGGKIWAEDPSRLSGTQIGFTVPVAQQANELGVIVPPRPETNRHH